MRIGIDISQLAYQNTGVANYLGSLVANMVDLDNDNQYVLFFSSLRRSIKYQEVSIKYKNKKNVQIKEFKFPPAVLNIMWNKLHIFPIENFIGDVDVFITSDWTEPPAKNAHKATILYDLIVYKYPKETAQKIIDVQKRKLKWVKEESDVVFCISKATKKDAIEILRIPESKLKVIYPGFTM